MCVCFSSNNIIICNRGLIGGGKGVKGVLGNYYFFFVPHLPDCDKQYCAVVMDVGYIEP